MPSNSQWPWRDGLILFYAQGYWVMMCGWNPGTGIFTPGPCTNEIWISSNDGTTWNYIGIAPFSPRHWVGAQIKKSTNTLIVLGGDYYINTQDVWTYDLSQGVTNLAVSGNWINRTTNWGAVAGNRILYSHWMYNDKFRISGGQIGVIGSPTMFNDVLELNETTWQFETVGVLPISNASTHITIQTPTENYMFGGGRYIDGGGHDNANLNLYKSLNGGASYTFLQSLPAGFDGFMYPAGTWFDGKINILNGAAGAPSPGNRSGLWSLSVNGVWVSYNYIPAARHATGMAVNDLGDKMMIATGNTVNDVLLYQATEI